MSTSASPCPPRPQVYRPRQPKTTALCQIVSTHGKRLEAVWEDRFQERYGPLRRVVPKTFDAIALARTPTEFVDSIGDDD